MERLEVTCSWCEETCVFDGADPEEEWRQSGWMIHLTDDGEHDYCSLDCCISAMNP